MSSYAISQEVNLQTAIWAIGGAIYTVARWVSSLVKMLAIAASMVRVSWEPTVVIAACKTVAAVAVVVAGLAVTVTYPAAIVFVFVVWLALMIVKKW